MVQASPPQPHLALQRVSAVREHFARGIVGQQSWLARSLDAHALVHRPGGPVQSGASAEQILSKIRGSVFTRAFPAAAL